VANQPADNSNRIAVIKAALLQTTSTTGWEYIKGMSDNAVRLAMEEALDEEDPVLGESKRLKAAALKKGFAKLFDAIETIKNTDLETDDAGMGEIS
jgi:hypothetical protein